MSSQRIQLLLAGKLVGLQCGAVAAQQQQVSKCSRNKCGCCTCSAATEALQPQTCWASRHGSNTSFQAVVPALPSCAERLKTGQRSPAPPGTALAGAAATAASTPAGFPHARCSGGGRHGCCWWLAGHKVQANAVQPSLQRSLKNQDMLPKSAAKQGYDSTSAQPAPAFSGGPMARTSTSF